MLAYQRALARSPDELTALLDKHAAAPSPVAAFPRSNATLDALKERLEALAASIGFAGRIIVIADPAVGAGDARISRLSWKGGGAYGLTGGAADVDFVAYGLNFALARPTKLPVLDGALAIDNFAMAVSLVASRRGVALLPVSAENFLKWSVISRPLKGEAPTIDLVVGYHKANTSPILRTFLSRIDDLTCRISSKARRVGKPGAAAAPR